MIQPVTATYRLQLHKRFTLKDVIEIVDYLEALGISHLYLSPIFRAKKESMHGYDVVDYSVINPEIGCEKDLRELSNKLKMRNMGVILDIVPNHMCITSIENTFWQDVLLNGRQSPYACFFDIDWRWDAEDLFGKVLQPFLAETLDKALSENKFTLKHTESGSYICYNELCFPMKNAEEKDLVKALEEQCYRLDFWKRGNVDLNYRRFFEIAELACLRQEEPKVFETTHHTLFRWIDKGYIDGVRIDHIDGLREPKKYLKKLRNRIGKRYMIVEKILMGDEEIRSEWDVDGTTGYDYLNMLNCLFVKEDLTHVYIEFTNEHHESSEIEKECKRLILNTTMQSEWKRLSKMITDDLKPALFEVVISFSVYRTYFSFEPCSTQDQAILDQVIEYAKQATHIEKHHFDNIKALIINDNELAMRLQLLTAPLMAKGVEDTALYRYFPLSSLNEVGASLNKKALSIEKYHALMKKRKKIAPISLSATTTHDAKRSEDVRARIHVLSEIPDIWKETLEKWKSINQPIRKDSYPDSNDEYLLYQTLIGTYSKEGASNKYIDRIIKYMLKAIKEAKRHTSWIDPNQDYEASLEEFIRALFKPSHPFENILKEFIETNILYPGMYNALSQTLLKMTSPGVPDFYQGCESWQYTLVDPDNRNPVDFQKLKQIQDDKTNPLLSGKAKMDLIQNVLNFRKNHQKLFSYGSYIPIEVSGLSNHLIAFLTEFENQSVIVITARFFHALCMSNNQIDLKHFNESYLISNHLPINRTYRSILTHNEVVMDNGKILIKDVFKNLPLDILEKI